MATFRTYGTQTVPKLLEKVNIIDIVNDIASGGTGVPLSAEQGKVLNTKVSAEASTRAQQFIDLVGTATLPYNTLGKIEGVISSLNSSSSTDLANAVASLEAADSAIITAYSAADTALSSTITANKLATDTAIANEAAARAAADTILSDDLAQEVLDRQTAITNEATARTNADAAEIARASAAELVNANAITAETSRASGAETTLQTNINAEQGRAEGVELTLQTAINTEVSNRTNADLSLNSRLAAIENGLVAGITWRASLADLVALDVLVEADVVEGWAYYVGVEKDVYVVVPGTNGDYRPATWTGVDAAAKSFLKFADFAEVTGLINAETSRATTAETELSNNLALEGTTRATADNTITTNLNNEITRASTAEGLLDGRLITIEGLDTVVGSIAFAVKAERTRAVAEEARIENLVAQEVTDRQTAVAGERTRAESEEARIEGLVTAEVTNRIADVNAEETRATNAEQLIASNLTAEIANRTAADNAEIAIRLAADNALSGRLDIVEGADIVVGSIAKALKDAKQEIYDQILVPLVQGMGGTLLVVGDTVTVNHVIADGINGIIFGEVVVYNAVGEALAVNVASVTGSVITLAVTAVGEFAGLQCKVSYFSRAVLDTGAGTGVAGSGLAGA